LVIGATVGKVLTTTAEAGTSSIRLPAKMPQAMPTAAAEAGTNSIRLPTKMPLAKPMVVAGVDTRMRSLLTKAPRVNPKHYIIERCPVKINSFDDIRAEFG
jgi:hypothetical protein